MPRHAGAAGHWSRLPDSPARVKPAMSQAPASIAKERAGWCIVLPASLCVGMSYGALLTVTVFLTPLEALFGWLLGHHPRAAPVGEAAEDARRRPAPRHGGRLRPGRSRTLPACPAGTYRGGDAIPPPPSPVENCPLMGYQISQVTGFFPRRGGN